jgi:hypothetical protein
MPLMTRRDFIRTAAAATALPLATLPFSSHAAGAAIPMRWLDGDLGAPGVGATFTLPWPRGEQKQVPGLVMQSAAGDIPAQGWPLARWPDGSLKWSAHALPAGHTLPAQPRLAAGASKPATPLAVRESADAIEIDTGLITCVFGKSGAALIRSIRRAGRETLRNGILVLQCDDQPDASAGTVRQARFTSRIGKVTLEQAGPVRAVVKIEGQHTDGARAWLPFTVRLYLYAGGDALRIMHTFIFDGDEQKDFLSGIGVRFDVPLSDPLHDRHVRFAGEDGGLWAEGVRNLTGLRRDPGAAVRQAQVDGLACPPLDQFPANVRGLLHLVPAWGDYSLSQLSADGFDIKKRTKSGYGWVPAAFGKRAPGSGYIGGASGGVAFGLRDFWQRHPTQLDIRAAHTDSAQVTLWMLSPDAPTMDMRFYHDGMGMETHEQELQGLDITYEDYEKGYGSPVGVARSSEITLWALAATPARERMVQYARAVQTPAQLVAEPARYLASAAFGTLWSLPDRSVPAKAAIEDRLDQGFDFYRKQVEQRHWYGFWDYGDIRHTYDTDRHEWRYDVGGFAWDNSELSPDLWLWYSFLRSGRADIFRLAEAMVRHTSEVDTYHLGRFAGLGSRHNVQHWGCSAKQVRISAAIYRRFYYYLTADERIGDIMHSLLDADQKLDEVDPVRKITRAPDKGGYPARIAFGTDWGSLAGNWLTEWERSGDRRSRDKLLAGMRDIAAMPKGFFSANRAGYEPSTGRMHNLVGDTPSAAHLNAVFGAVEVFAELIAITGDKDFEKAWVQYCELYNASAGQQTAALGQPHGGGTVLYVGHSRLTAYAAWRKKDPELARRAWREFANNGKPLYALAPVTVKGAAVLNPVEEIPSLSTNDMAQWGLAAIQNLALIGEHL